MSVKRCERRIERHCPAPQLDTLIQAAPHEMVAEIEQLQRMLFHHLAVGLAVLWLCRPAPSKMNGPLIHLGFEVAQLAQCVLVKRGDDISAKVRRDHVVGSWNRGVKEVQQESTL